MSDVLVTLDDLPTLGAQTYGDGNPWGVGGNEQGQQRLHIGGLFDRNPRLHDLERDHGDGDIQGPAYNAPTTITVPIFIEANDLTTSDVLDHLNDLYEAWASYDGDPATLTIVQWGHTYVRSGMPAGLKVNDSGLLVADVRALCTFKVYAELTGS